MELKLINKKKSELHWEHFLQFAIYFNLNRSALVPLLNTVPTKPIIENFIKNIGIWWSKENMPA